MRTYNEAENLPISLPNWLRFCDEIVISDGGSTDGTREVAESIVGDRLVWLDFPGGSIHNQYHQNHAGKQLNYGLDHCQGDWVITHDADTIFCDRFVADIRDTLASARHEAYIIFGVHVVDDWHHYIDNMLDGPGVVQIFRRDSGARFPDRPEEAAFVEGFKDENVHILRLGSYHWGYLSRSEHQRKRRRRVEVFADTELGSVFRRALEAGTNWSTRTIPWHACHAECEACWIRERALGRREERGGW